MYITWWSPESTIIIFSWQISIVCNSDLLLQILSEELELLLMRAFCCPFLGKTSPPLHTTLWNGVSLPPTWWPKEYVTQAGSRVLCVPAQRHRFLGNSRLVKQTLLTTLTYSCFPGVMWVLGHCWLLTLQSHSETETTQRQENWAVQKHSLDANEALDAAVSESNPLMDTIRTWTRSISLVFKWFLSWVSDTSTWESSNTNWQKLWQGFINFKLQKCEVMLSLFK
jgi:hypothetical protein